MPRTGRIGTADHYFHVTTRGNRRQRTFIDPEDYRTLFRVLNETRDHVRVDIAAFCLMPNHIHAIVRPRIEGDLGRWMHRVLTSYVRRFHKRHGSDGRLWQGRYKSFLIENDHYLLTVVRYVERNPLRAKLVDRAEAWPWSSLGQDRRFGPIVPLATVEPRRRRDWIAFVNTPLSISELDAVRTSVQRGAPYGSEEWQAHIVRELGLESTVRPRGRPRSRA